ncbi:MAG: Uma2 family endonuclease [Planctomycetota bacterium]|nr:Uma2 family endonuclease [Planctomycetota bacterium]
MATELEAESTTANASSNGEIPTLQAGDRLTLDEFLQRYETMPDVDFAELVEGVVYMSSPVSADGHGEPHFDFVTWLGVYRARTAGVLGGDNSTLKLDLDNAPQPDGYLRLLPEHGGRARLADGYLEGAPELIVEISASSASYDLHDKLQAYRRNGVREYVVWRVWDRAVDWFKLQEGRFEKQQPSGGVLKSQVFPGLWLDVDAVIAGDLARVLDVLAEGLASDDHVEFAARLRSDAT